MSRARWMILPAVAVAVIAVVLWRVPLQHWLAVHTGSSNVPGAPPAGAFWSGFGSDLGEFALVGGFAGLLRKHNCHVKRCPRIGRHHVEGTSFVVCRKHSPAGAPTHAEVLAAHDRALKQNRSSEGSGS